MKHDSTIPTPAPVAILPPAKTWEQKKIAQLERLKQQTEASIHCISRGHIFEDDTIRKLPFQLMVLGDFIIVDVGRNED